MQVGNYIIIDKIVYVYTNSSGTMERLCRIKWYAKLYLEIRQGINKPLPLVKLRDFCFKYKL